MTKAIGMFSGGLDSLLAIKLIKDQGIDVDVLHYNIGFESLHLDRQIKHKAAEENRKVTDYVQVVVSDIEMPSMDGHSLCRKIKEDNDLKHLPVILFSSLITDKLRHKGDSVGADDQISKPEISAVASRSIALIEAARDQGH